MNNISSYEIVFGRKPPVLSSLQLLSDNMTRPCNYNFADYLDLLNECFNLICSIVMGLHNEEVAKINTAHSAGSPTLRDFHEGDIIYCHFPSKTLMAELGLQSRKIKMNFIGPLYIYSKFDKFQFVLSTIDGEVIEQLFHVAWLKKGLLKLPNGKVANNINDYLKYKQDLQSTLQTATPPVGNEAASMQASADSSSLMHVDLFKRSSAWCTSPQTIYLSNVGARNLSSQSSYFCPITSLQAKTDIFPQFLPTQMDLAEYCYITKS